MFANFFSEPFDEENFSFWRVFPFEVVKNSNNKKYFYLVSLYIFIILCFSPILVLKTNQIVITNIEGLSILTSCVLGVSAILFLFMNIFDVTHVKVHLTLFTFFFSLAILLGLLLNIRGLTCFITLQKHGHFEFIYIVSIILNFLSIIVLIGLICNPKLSRWAELEKIEGEEKFRRPKKFPLAYTEWGVFLTLFIEGISFFLQLVVA